MAAHYKLRTNKTKGLMTQPFDVLNPWQKMTGNFFIEASAGTGKTFTIAHAVVRLLIEPDMPTPFSKMGIITFTKAACNELKKRIKELLFDLKMKLETGEPCFISTLNVEPQEALFRIKLALESFDEAAIFTIHGLSFHLLRKHALTLSLPLEPKDPEKSPIESLCYDLIKKCLYDPAIDHLLSLPQKQALLATARGDFHQLITSLSHKTLSMVDIEPQESWPELKMQIASSLKKLPTYPGIEAMGVFLENYKFSPLTQNELKNQLNLFDQVCLGKRDIDALLFKKSFLNSIHPEKLKVKKTIDTTSIAFCFISGFIQTVQPLLDKALHPGFLELTLAAFCRKALHKELKEKNIFSFDALLKTLNEKLDDPLIAKALSSEFEIMIVDEFQDTDPVQWSILKKLCIDHPVKAFYMVGDPKQAIYTFRSADVYTYLEAKRNCPNVQLGVLDTCYRSTLKLVEALNDFFSKAPWQSLPYLNETFPYHPVKPKEGSVADLGSPLTFYPLVDEDDQAIGDLIQKIHRQYPHDTLGVLVKDRYQSGRIETILNQKKLKNHSFKNETLEHSILFSLLEALLVLVEAPVCESSLNRFLCSSWFNYTLSHFEKNTRAIHKKTELEIAYLSYNTFLNKGLLEALETLLNTTWPTHEQPLRFEIGAVYGKDTLDKLFYIATLVYNHEAKDPLIQRLYLNTLKKAKHPLPQIPEKNTLIHLMTTHMSKGLEFDHVLALGIATRQKNGPSTLIQRIKGKLELTPAHPCACQINAYEEIECEKLRQQYVALTRAKKTVHIPIIQYPLSHLDWGDLSPLEYYLLKIVRPTSSYADIYKNPLNFTSIIYELKTLLKEPLYSFQTIQPLKEVSLDKDFVVYLDTSKPVPSCVQKNTLSFTSLKTDSSLAKVDDLLKGKEYGDFFHGLIEKLLKNGSYLSFETEKTQQWLTSLIGLSYFNAHTQAILAHIKTALYTPFPVGGKSCTLSQIPRKDLIIEAGFSYKTGPDTLVGFIDCIFIYKNQIFLIDWKTSFLHDTSALGIKRHMEESSYFLQLDIYKQALVKQKSYFSEMTIGGLFYLFVKQGALYTHLDLEALC